MPPSAEHEILLVEDNPADIDLFKFALADSDLDGTLRTTQTGEEALRVLDEESVDLVVLDVDLPGRSGMDVLEELNSDAWSMATPVLIFSTSEDPERIRDAYELGANAYLVKRMDFEDTVSLVETLDEFWLNAAELPG